MHYVKTSLAALGLALAVSPAAAQVNANNLVNVNISDIEVDLENLLGEGINLTVADNIVQVPIGIAANVCPSFTAAVLAEDARSGDASCTAENASQALARAARRQSM